MLKAHVQGFTVGIKFHDKPEEDECELCGENGAGYRFIIFPPKHPALTFCWACAFHLGGDITELMRYSRAN